MLEARAVKLSFGGVRAVDEVSISVGQGRIVGLIGTNGAGKTTLFNVISGFLRAEAGRILLEGRDVTRAEPHEIAARGLIRTFQTPIGFPRLTVLENLLVFARDEAPRRSRILGSPAIPAAVGERAMRILEGFGLAARRDVWAQDLSAPELKMLEFARAMMTEPRILLLDEPAAGVNPAVLDALAERIRGMRAAGVTFLIVDHNLKFICDICEDIYAMADGRVIAHGPPAEVISNPDVVELYIGRRSEREAA